jgi:hypothetical protein
MRIGDMIMTADTDIDTHLESDSGIRRAARILLALAVSATGSAAQAQDVRYSWFEVSYVKQDVARDATFTDLSINQTVNISTTDGDGIKFRGSVGTWKNLFVFLDFNSSDIDVAATVINDQGEFSAADEFDFTSIRGGLGAKWSIAKATDLYATVSFDSTDLDFGSFAGENFDVDDQGAGGSVGVRSMIGDRLELRAHARYSQVGDMDITTRESDTDTLYGVGFGIELVRGLSIVGDYEDGAFSSWSVGFRLDLDED